MHGGAVESGVAHGDMQGHCIQQQVRSLVDFAADRGITVVPEFDILGKQQRL
jgi:N-acetyl-beta-hexosaminidase